MKKITAYNVKEKIFESERDALNFIYEKTMKMIEPLAREIAKLEPFRYIEIADYIHDHLSDFIPIIDMDKEKEIEEDD